MPRRTDGAPIRAPGWYERPERPGVKRYFDGEAWTENFAPASTPVDAPPSVGTGPEPPNVADSLLPGLALGAVGGALAAGGSNSGNELVVLLGLGTAAAGGLFCLVGAVAAGVRRGIRLADFDRKLQR